MTYVPRPGDFGLAPGGGAAMWAVRLGTFSRYGHAVIAEELTQNSRVQVIEPMPTGCRRRVAEPGEFVWSGLDMHAEQAASIVHYAQKCLGLPYDWPAIAGFVVRFWGAKLRGKSGDHADDKLICSEMVVWAYRQAGIDLCPGKAPGDCSPGDLDQWLDDRRRA